MTPPELIIHCAVVTEGMTALSPIPAPPILSMIGFEERSMDKTAYWCVNFSLQLIEVL